MKRKDILTLLVLGVLLGVSFIGMTSSQGDAVKAQYLFSFGKSQSLVQSAISIPIIAGVDLEDDSFNRSTRGEIFNYVRVNPGVHFRGICMYLGMSVGVVQYHLDLLTSAGHLISRREKRYKRYFESGRFSETDIKVISALRNGTARKIFIILLGKPALRHASLASLLDISSQALTWQMKRLKATGLIEVESEGRRVRYSVTEENLSTITEFLDLLF